jgi:hypothetical protein
MAAIAATDVTYALSGKQVEESGLKRYQMSVTFGDGALTYPTGGVPLTAGKMGVPTQIKELSLVSPAAGDGYVYKYDLANNKIVIYFGDYSEAGDGPLVEIPNTDTPAATTLVLSVLGW